MEATVGPFGRALCALVLWCYAMPAAAVAGDIAGLQSVFSGEVEAWQAGASDAMDRGGLWSHRTGLSELWHRYRDPVLALTAPQAAVLSDEELQAAFDLLGGFVYAVGLDAPRSDSADVNPRLLGRLAQVQAERASRGLAGDYDADTVHALAFASRLWDLAHRLQEATTHDAALPRVALEPGPDAAAASRQVWRLDPSGRVLQRASALSLADVDWVVLVGPGCGPANQAVDAIASDPSLSALFEARSAWLVRPGMEAMAFDEMRAWNNRHPAFGLSIIDHLDDWPEFDASPVSPLFLRVEDGVVTGFHVGWAASGSPAEQLEWLRNPHRVVR